MDCSKNATVCDAQGVDGYPSMLLFKGKFSLSLAIASGQSTFAFVPKLLAIADVMELELELA